MEGRSNRISGRSLVACTSSPLSLPDVLPSSRLTRWTSKTGNFSRLLRPCPLHTLLLLASCFPALLLFILLLLPLFSFLAVPNLCISHSVLQRLEIFLVFLLPSLCTLLLCFLSAFLFSCSSISCCCNFHFSLFLNSTSEIGNFICVPFKPSLSFRTAFSIHFPRHDMQEFFFPQYP